MFNLLVKAMNTTDDLIQTHIEKLNSEGQVQVSSGGNKRADVELFHQILSQLTYSANRILAKLNTCTIILM